MDDRPVSLPDPDLLTPIEEEFWTSDGAKPPGASLAVRGAPITAEKFLAHAVRQAREFSLRGANMASVSMDLVLADWPLERILANQLATYTRYGTCRVDDLEGRGFEVLATGRQPHADIVLPALSIVEAGRLSDLFAGREQRNPQKRRR